MNKEKRTRVSKLLKYIHRSRNQYIFQIYLFKKYKGEEGGKERVNRERQKEREEETGRNEAEKGERGEKKEREFVHTHAH